VSGKTDVGFVCNRAAVAVAMLRGSIKDTFCTLKWKTLKFRVPVFCCNVMEDLEHCAAVK
jgi:hypothetical protein